MMSDILTVAFVTSLLAGMVRIMSPILLAALGELVTERGGVMNLGVEGTMLVGALVGFLIGYQTGSLCAGVLGAVTAGGLVGLLMAFLSATLKADQTIAGLSINILASGLTFYLFRVAFSTTGTENLPNLPVFETVPIPLLSHIPVIGKAVFSQYVLSYGAFLLVPLIYLFLFRTKYGLTLRGIGENPRAIDMKGVNVSLYQYAATIFGGMLAGAGGGYLTLAQSGMFVPGISSGRGWIAIAIVIFGDWKPLNILLAALFFALLDSLQLQIQGIGIQLPYQIFLALPYLLTILALVVKHGRGSAPLHLGLPYHRE